MNNESYAMMVGDSLSSPQVRFVGLSTALANPRDVADWLGVKDTGLYNFRPSVRPIPCEVHIQVRGVFGNK